MKDAGRIWSGTLHSPPGGLEFRMEKTAAKKPESRSARHVAKVYCLETALLEPCLNCGNKSNAQVLV